MDTFLDTCRKVALGVCAQRVGWFITHNPAKPSGFSISSRDIEIELKASSKHLYHSGVFHDDRLEKCI